MSIVQDEKELEYWSDQKLLEEAQNPTGRMPLFLIHTQIEKRKNYRASANARKETPDTTIYEEDVAEFGGGGLGSMQQQMSMPPPPTQQMPPPQQMPMSAPPQQMPMSAPPLQAGMGVTPMARGGLIKAKKGVHLPRKDLSAIGEGYRGTRRVGNLTRKQLEELEKKIKSYKSNLKLSPMQAGGALANEANKVAAKGRFGDTMLVHMNPMEVAAMNQNGNLNINPQTGLPEAFAFAPLFPWLAGAGRAYMGRSGLSRGLAALRSRLPGWMGGASRKRVTPKGGSGVPYGSLRNPRKTLPVQPTTTTPNLPALRPLPAVIPKGGPGGPGWMGGVGGHLARNKWRYGGLGLAGLGYGIMGGEEEEPPIVGGGVDRTEGPQTSTESRGLRELASQYYPEFMQPQGEYQEELSGAESYRRTPAQRKAEAQGIAFSGLAKAFGNVGMGDIISGVADVAPEVIALRKYQTEEQRVVDKNIADLRKGRRGEKLGIAGLAGEWEKTQISQLAMARQMAMEAYQADLQFARMYDPNGKPTYTLQQYLDYYLNGTPLPITGQGTGAAAQLQQQLPPST